MAIRSLYVGIPVYGDFKAATVESLVPALGKAGAPIMFDVQRNTYIPVARELLAERAVAAGASHLLMIDADMKFPADLIPRLAAWDKDIIAVNAAVRGLSPEGERISMVKMGDGPGKWKPHKITDFSKPFQAGAVGTPLILIRTAVFEGMPKPWFDCTAGADTQNMLGEDIYFCAKAKEHGFEVWCDPTIDVGHVGEFVY